MEKEFLNLFVNTIIKPCKVSLCHSGKSKILTKEYLKSLNILTWTKIKNPRTYFKIKQTNFDKWLTIAVRLLVNLISRTKTHNIIEPQDFIEPTIRRLKINIPSITERDLKKIQKYLNDFTINFKFDNNKYCDHFKYNRCGCTWCLVAFREKFEDQELELYFYPKQLNDIYDDQTPIFKHYMDLIYIYKEQKKCKIYNFNVNNELNPDLDRIKLAYSVLLFADSPGINATPVDIKTKDITAYSYYIYQNKQFEFTYTEDELIEIGKNIFKTWNERQDIIFTPKLSQKCIDCKHNTNCFKIKKTEPKAMILN